MGTLAAFTTAINLAALAMSLWLGLYVLTRSPNSPTARLAFAALWMLAAYFFQSALAIHYDNAETVWLRTAVLFLIPVWTHLTFLLLPRPLRQNWMAWGVVPLGYLFAATFLVLSLVTDLMFGSRLTASLYTSARLPGPAYAALVPFFLSGIVLTTGNLWRARRASKTAVEKASLNMFIAATGIVAAAGAYVIGGTLFRLDLPFWVADLGFAAAISLFGYAVARHNATLSGRPIERDFSYTLLVVGSLTLLYCLVVLGLYLQGQVSFITLALAVSGTVVANTLFDRLRLAFDNFFYQGHFRRLRANLRTLAHEAGTGLTLAERLQAILNSACRFLGIERAFIAVLQEGRFVVQATHESHALGTSFPDQALAANEIMGLVLPARKNLQDMKLLIPLFAEGRQIGAVVLGPRSNGSEYQENDLELIEDLGDKIAQIIHAVVAQEQYAQRLNALVEDFRERERQLQLQEQQIEIERPQAAKSGTTPWDEEKLGPLVEDAFRHLHDYAYLGEHALAEMRIAELGLARRETATSLTFVDRGKALSETLIQALNALRPDIPLPKGTQVLPREWHLYTILHDSYVQGDPNRDIMGKLYISEGTFNRTRRRALRAVAKALAEMEETVSQTANDPTQHAHLAMGPR